MNKKGQPINLNGVFVGVITLILLGIVLLFIRQVLAPCPECDYSPLEESLSKCVNDNSNLSKIIDERPIEYINNTIYIPEYKSLPKAEIIYSYIFIGFSTILVLFFSFKFHLFKINHLFKIEIKELPEEWKTELERLKSVVTGLTKSIKLAKGMIITFAVLLVIKLIILIFST